MPNTPQDASIGFAIETTYRTGVTPVRWVNYTADSLQWSPNFATAVTRRLGSRGLRLSQDVVPTADGSGGWEMPAISKGMGLLLQACLGTATSTLVSGTTYQQVFTPLTSGASLPSMTVQRALPMAGGTLDTTTFLGCAVDTWELDFAQGDFVMVKPTLDVGDVTTATAYATPAYTSDTTSSLFHFAGGSIYSGTLTAPTTTVLGSALTPLTDVRGGSVQFNNNLTKDRFNLGQAGRKAQPTIGQLDISGTLNTEFANTTWRDLLLNQNSLSLVLTWTGGALSTGLETLQLILPAVRVRSPLPQTNGADLITTDISFTAFDNGVNPMAYVVTRTSDTAL